MTLYRHRQTQPLKWLVALIVFALTMGVTFTDVYGYDGTSSPTTNDGSQPNSDDTRLGNEGSSAQSSSTSPTVVPEPTTLILLAGGLSALYVARRQRKKNR